MLDLLLENRVDAQRIASVIMALAMWRWGGAPERILALTFVGLFTLPLLFLDFATAGTVMFSDRGYLIVAIDVLAGLIFVGLALHANRNYPLWIAGFQVVAVTAHLARGIVEAITPIAYAVMVIGPSYFQLILMLAGLVRHLRRKQRHGEYRDWRIPSGDGLLSIAKLDKA